MSRYHNMQKFSLAMGTILAALTIPSISLAERPEIDCETLDENVLNEFYDLSSKYVTLRDQKNYSEALVYANKAMAICTTDSYTEYTIARLNQLLDNCPEAYYHYEILSKKPDSVKAKDKEIFEDIDKQFAEIKEKCGDVVDVEIQCDPPDTVLTISGLPNSNIKCPFYGKLSPKTYSVIATRDGYQTKTESIEVPATGAKIKFPALRDNNAVGTFHIRCEQKDASAFVLVNSDGETSTYPCPSADGTIPEGTYKVYLSDQDPATAETIVISRQQNSDFLIHKVQTSRCSATPLDNSSSPYGIALFALLSFFGLTVVRRKNQS